MKWAVLIPQYLPETVGGNTVYVREFSRQLVKCGHDVHIFSTSLRRDLPSQELDSGVTVHRVLVKSGSAGPLRLSSVRKLTDRFLEIDAAVGFDVLNPNAAFQIDYSKLRNNLKVVHTAHAVATYEYIYLIRKVLRTLDVSAPSLREILASPVKLPVAYVRERTALRRADRIVVMSCYVQQSVVKFLGGESASKIIVSKIGIDPAQFYPVVDKAKLRSTMGLSATGIVFFTARRLAHRMGLENLLDAFASCVRANPGKPLYLLVAGSGALRGRLESRLSLLNLGSRVRLLGFVTDQDLLSYYQCADAFVLPSEDLEGFGIVSIEAMACNLPVIATPVGANREVVGSVLGDLVTTSASAASIAETMNRFVSDIDRYRRTNVVRGVSEKYSWQNIVEALLRDIA